MTHEVKSALRSLLKTPGFTAAALVILGVGIGASTIVFSIVDAMLLRPLPFGDHADRLVTVHSTHPTQAQDWDDSRLSYADLLDLRESSRTFEGVEAVLPRNFSVAGANQAERVSGASVTPGLFALLSARPQLGRGFREDDAQEPGFEAVALLSDALWHRRFAGDPSIVGRTVLLNGRAVTVIGIMPPLFRFPDVSDIWLPYAGRRDAERAARSLQAFGVLRPGVSLETARAEADAVAARLAERHPATNRGWGLHVMRVRDFLVPPATRRGLSAMLGAVLLVLLVGCANIASLLLARGMGRERELAVRSAMGARRRHLVTLLLVESLVLATGGALLGLLLSGWGVDAIVATNPEPLPYWFHIGADARTLLFVSLLTVATALACGLVPALRLTGANLAGSFSGGGRTGINPGQRRAQAVLVVGQVALSLALLVTGTLLVRSVRDLARQDPGFDPKPLLSLRVYLAGDQYDDPAARARAINRIVEELSRIPGAAAAAATGAIPADDGGQTVRLAPERGVAVAGDELGVQMIPVTPGLWNVLNLRLADGRTFTSAESEDPTGTVAIVNRRLADRFWPGESAVGRNVGLVSGAETRWFTVVGVSPDLAYEEFGEQTDPSQFNLYLPGGVAGPRTTAFLVRAESAPGGLGSGARAALRRVDPGLAAHDVLTMPDRLAATQWGQRFLGRMFGAFAAVGLLLACIGAYGLMAYAARQRVREIGIRLTLGSTPGQIVKLLLGRGVRLAGAGLLVGLPLAVLGARAIEGLLFGVSVWSASTWVLLPLSLLAAVLLACYLPARRASRTDPADALRVE